MDIFTVIFTATMDGESESIPWQLSFSDLDLARNHVLEEAAAHALAFYGEALDSDNRWEDYEDYSTFVAKLDESTIDTWLIVRTELVEAAPSGQMSAL